MPRPRRRAGPEPITEMMGEAYEGLSAWAWRLALCGLGLEEGLALREAGAWRHLTGAAPDSFSSLLSVAVLDRFLRGDAARLPRIGLADARREGSAGVPVAEFTTEDGRADLPRLLAAFDGGASLVISQFQDLHPPLARLCRGLEKTFLHPVQANIYLTPPGAQGFAAHYDSHDVLVLQVAGEKRWRVWPAPPLATPTRLTRWTRGTAPVGAPVALTLRPGEALYLPRGVMHDAAAQEAGGGPALHITLGLLEPGMGDALRLLAEMLEREDAVFRAPCPIWRLPDTGTLSAALAPMLARLATPEAAETLALGLLDRLAADRPVLPARGLVAGPLPSGMLRLTEAMHHHAVPLPQGGALLRWAGTPVPVAERALPALAALAEGVAWDGLDEAGRQLVATLWPLGLVEAVAEG